MEKKETKTRSPNVWVYLYPSDLKRLTKVIHQLNEIAMKNGKPRVTKSGELEKLVKNWLNRTETKHSNMPMFRDK